MQIVGVGFGPTPINANWVEEEGYLYEVWNDLNKTLALYYGAAANSGAFFPNRLTRLLDAEGSVLLEYNDVYVGAHPQEVLEDCQAIFGD